MGGCISRRVMLSQVQEFSADWGQQWVLSRQFEMPAADDHLSNGKIPLGGEACS